MENDEQPLLSNQEDGKVSYFKKLLSGSKRISKAIEEFFAGAWAMQGALYLWLLLIFILIDHDDNHSDHENNVNIFHPISRRADRIALVAGIANGIFEFTLHLIPKVKQKIFPYWSSFIQFIAVYIMKLRLLIEFYSPGCGNGIYGTCKLKPTLIEILIASVFFIPLSFFSAKQFYNRLSGTNVVRSNCIAPLVSLINAILSSVSAGYLIYYAIFLSHLNTVTLKSNIPKYTSLALELPFALLGLTLSAVLEIEKCRKRTHVRTEKALLFANNFFQSAFQNMFCVMAVAIAINSPPEDKRAGLDVLMTFYPLLFLLSLIKSHRDYRHMVGNLVQNLTAHYSIVKITKDEKSEVNGTRDQPPSDNHFEPKLS